MQADAMCKYYVVVYKRLEHLKTLVPLGARGAFRQICMIPKDAEG